MWFEEFALSSGERKENKKYVSLRLWKRKCSALNKEFSSETVFIIECLPELQIQSFEAASYWKRHRAMPCDNYWYLKWISSVKGFPLSNVDRKILLFVENLKVDSRRKTLRFVIICCFGNWLTFTCFWHASRAESNVMRGHLFFYSYREQVEDDKPLIINSFIIIAAKLVNDSIHSIIIWSKPLNLNRRLKRNYFSCLTMIWSNLSEVLRY